MENLTIKTQKLKSKYQLMKIIWKCIVMSYSYIYFFLIKVTLNNLQQVISLPFTHSSNEYLSSTQQKVMAPRSLHNNLKWQSTLH